MSIYPVGIIGAGPAGLATALQLQRYGVDALLLEGGYAGGLLHNANCVENYPGFPGGISGPELVRLFIAQAEQIGVRLTHELVLSLDYSGVSAPSANQEGWFSIQTAERSYQARRVVIASGTRPVPLSGVSIPVELKDRFFYEVYPLLETEGRHIAILGAGDAAFDYALNLRRRNRVTILNRGDRVSCLPLLWERASAEASIEYRPNTSLRRVFATPEGRFGLECATPNGLEMMSADALLAAIGREARLDFIAPSLRWQLADLESQGLLYCVGDVKNGLHRQTAIAVGDGIIAAMKIYQSLTEFL
jgi:thioredoxin reductase